MREAMATFAGARERMLLGVLSGVGHDHLRGWHDDGAGSPPRPECRQGER
jgi:hypothetical protein